MGKALFSASKTLGDPSALRPQGDKKGASGRHGGRVVLEGADATEGPRETLRCPFGLSASGLRLRVT